MVSKIDGVALGSVEGLGKRLLRVYVMPGKSEDAREDR
jgi:hypothetical protein